jgi:drug/metabolite transporter (DMT)-like permease
VNSPRNAAALPAILLLLAANLLWAGQGVAIKRLAVGLPPVAVALLPLYCTTVIGLVLIFLRGGAAQKFGRAWRLRREFCLAGICGQLTAQVGMTLGVNWSTASNGAILSLLIPIFGALIAVRLLRERLTGLRIGALLLGFAGVLLLSPLQRLSGREIHIREVAGNLLIAIGCLGSAFYNVYSKRLLQHFSGLETLFFSYLSTTIFSLPILFATEPHCLDSLRHLELPQWVAFAYLVIFLYGLSMVFFLKALDTVDAVVASTSLYLTPIFGLLFAFMLLGERLTPLALGGAAIVLLATLMLFRFDYSFQFQPVSSRDC